MVKRYKWAFRATSTKTRIETKIYGQTIYPYGSFQSDIHENKDWNSVTGFFVALGFVNFQSDIHENKDWNIITVTVSISRASLSERHPRKQGLKPVEDGIVDRGNRLSERHPRKQGLKHQYIAERVYTKWTFRATSTKTRIETQTPPPCKTIRPTFRATSTKTRIETKM